MARLAGLAAPPRLPGAPKTSPQPSRQDCTSAPPAGAGVPPSPQLALRSWSRFDQDLERCGSWSRGLRWRCGEFDPR